MIKQTKDIYDFGGYIPLMPPGRRCSECNKPLSRYNKGDRCFACTRKFIDSLPDTPIKPLSRTRKPTQASAKRQEAKQEIPDELKVLEKREEPKAKDK